MAKAAVLREVNAPLDIADIELDDCAPHEVRIQTATAGLCHSDLGIMTGEFGYGDLPLILGHESAGTVTAVGSEVTYVKPGDRVMTHVSGFCGHCDACLTGRSHMCHHLPIGKATLGRPADARPRTTLDGQNVSRLADLGSFAEEMLVHEHAVVRIPDDVPFAVAAIMGCGVTTGLGAVLNTARVAPGSTVAVVGCGGVGLAAVQGAVIAGARRVIAVDLSAERLDRAAALGATDVVNASEGDSVATVQELTGGGVDYAFDTAGGAATVAQAFSMLAIFGTCTAVGVTVGKTIEIPGTLLQMERKLQGCIMGSSNFRVDIPRWLEFYRQGRLKLDEFVSQHITLEQVNDGFAAMQRGEGARSVIDFD